MILTNATITIRNVMLAIATALAISANGAKATTINS
jgi:hypothetical protein